MFLWTRLEPFGVGCSAARDYSGHLRANGTPVHDAVCSRTKSVLLLVLPVSR